VQTRRIDPTRRGKREAIKYGQIDSAGPHAALFVECAILNRLCAVFLSQRKITKVGEIRTPIYFSRPCWRQRRPALLFALALLASRTKLHNSPALWPDKFVMEGFLNSVLPAVAATADQRVSSPSFRPLSSPPFTGPGARRACSSSVSGFEHAAQLRRLSAGHLHQRPPQDGRIRQTPSAEVLSLWTVAVVIALLNVWLFDTDLPRLARILLIPAPVPDRLRPSVPRRYNRRFLETAEMNSFNSRAKLRVGSATTKSSVWTFSIRRRAASPPPAVLDAHPAWKNLLRHENGRSVYRRRHSVPS